jgi:hypothetical protein
VLLATVLAGTAAAQTTVVTFDDLHTADYLTNNGVVSPQPAVALPPAPVFNGYAGLNWNSFYAIDGSLVSDQLDNAAPPNSVVSQFNTALSYSTNAGINSSTPFNLVSGYFNSLNTFNLTLEVLGYNGNTLLYDEIYTLAPTDQSVLTQYFSNSVNLCFSPMPQLLNLNMNGITDAQFLVYGGAQARFNASGGILAVDNLTYTPTPEPADWALLAFGGAGLGVALRARKAWALATPLAPVSAAGIRRLSASVPGRHLP